ncbi:MAG: ABC transporter permease, partial [Nitriliruptoraceae bacterium]
ALVVALAAGLLGWQPAGGAVAAPLAVLVGAVAFTSLGLLFAGALRAEATLALTNAIFLVLLLISGVTFDTAALPDALAVLGRALPLGALAQALRVALEGGSCAWSPLAVTAGWAVAAGVLASRTFRWEP